MDRLRQVAASDRHRHASVSRRWHDPDAVELRSKWVARQQRGDVGCRH
jgi:hypothetical protein